MNGQSRDMKPWTYKTRKQTSEKTEEIMTNGQSRDMQRWAHRQKTSMEMPMVLSIERTIFLSRR